ncbi:MAG: DNA mismatch repair endonuclease MutL [Eubacteriales bacterium]|nr:DNA mismatch repair endonuclease MutL [Eubacteriales bacterium]
MPITLLDQNTINKIAAGEVVERPSSVVKELVENAIDAGATAITVEIKEGGISFIRVTDNGSGINKDEIEIAFKRHATSKIKSIEDLMAVSSLGFRGEALASIAAVSQVELITKTANSISGVRYTIEGGVPGEVAEIGAPEGTTFIVRNLFYNTPVRRKFLKTATTEGGYIGSLVEYLALSHPDISFRFISNNQNKLHTSGNMNLKDIIYNVYGRDITNNLYEISGKSQDIEASGFIGKPMIVRGNRTYENYYINGRYIKSSIITKAIEDAYKGFIMPHNYPFSAIHFKINPAIIDVNVHPTKMELRFSNNEYIYNFVYDTCLKALNSKELIAEVSVPDPVAVKMQEAPVVRNVMPDIRLPEKNMAGKTQLQRQETAKEEQPQSGMVNQAVTSPLRTEVRPEIKMENKPERLPEPFEIKRSEQMVKEDKARYEAVAKSEPPKQMNLFENKLLDESSRNKYRIIGQLFDTYWLIEFEDKFYMMDQHAAHEKVLYERTMNKLHNKTIGTQMILPPIVLSLNMHEEEIYKANQDIFKRLGYEIEEFGGNEYKVTGIPAGLPKMDYKQLLIDVLDGLSEESANRDPDIITEKVASMSCKAAVKGNNRLSFNEAFELMDELMKAENPYNCPHGRPTLIMMSKYEIEKKFKRIV